MKRHLILLIAASVALGAFADTWTDSSGKTWSYTVAGSRATITDVSSVNGTLQIPSCISSYPVYGIGEEAFCDCSDITGVIFPEGLEVIGYDAFCGCENLGDVVIPSTVREGIKFPLAPKMNSITVDEGNPYFKSMDGVVYSKDGSRLVFFPSGRTGEWTVPNGVTVLEAESFAGASLSSVNIHAGVEELGRAVFIDCFKMTRFSVDVANKHYKDEDGVLLSKDGTRLAAYPAARGVGSAYTVPSTVTTLDEAAFSGSSLAGIILPSTLTTLPYEAFLDSSRLSSVIIGTGVKVVGHDSFYCASKLTGLTLPASVTSIENFAFEDCSSLKTIYVPEFAETDEYAYNDCPAKIVKYSSAPLVKFDLNYDGAPNYPYDRNVVSGQPVGILMTPVRTAADFAGWFTSGNGGSQITKDTVVIGDVTFYAQWTANQCGVITFNANGGKCGESLREVLNGNLVGELPVPTRDEYEFLGWYVEETKIDATYVVAGDITAVAHWKKREIADNSAEIRNVTAKQRYPWNGKVDISFEVAGDVTAGWPSWNMPRLFVTATDRCTGSNYAAADSALSGDTGTAAGTHHVVWDMDAQGLLVKSTNVVFEVAYATAEYCVIDLSAGANASSYPVSYLADVPSGGWTDEYKTTKLVLRLIAPGVFKMQNSTDVTLTKAFYCGVFEVTQKQYELVTGSNPSSCKGDMRPVESVSWDAIRGNSSTYNWPSSANVDSSTFIGRIQARTGLAFDLPTEAQWEYACRAGTTSAYNNGGNTENDLKLLGRYFGNNSDGKGGYKSVHTNVGSYAPNAWGLYDMHGNVWEWCLDWYGTLSYGTDPKGSSSGSDRVKRGGSWGSNANGCTSSYRNGYPSGGYYGGGFRLVRTLSE